MNPRLFELALKKQSLQFRCDEQRRKLERSLAPLVSALTVAEAVRKGLGWVRQHPALIAVAMATTFVPKLAAKPRRVMRWIRRAWFAWLALRRLMPAKAPAPPSQPG